MTVYIQPYKTTSASARLLRQVLDVPFLKSNTKLEPNDIIINWGSARTVDCFDEDCMHIINKPYNVGVAISKIDTLRLIGEEIYLSKEDLLGWLDSIGGLPEDMVIYCRRLSRSSKGKGIVVAHTVDDIVDAMFYTTAYPCKREYRVHVFGDNIIDVTAKVRVTDKTNPKYVPNPSKWVRNSDTGYVFARDAVKIPDKVLSNISTISKRAVQYTGLRFGAVDIVRDIHNNFKVLEINTAPGITGTSFDRYLEAINSELKILTGNRFSHAPFYAYDAGDL